MKIDFSEDQLKVIYGDLLRLGPVIYPEDKMKILMKIREKLDWKETSLEEESQ